jgi:hypothetical protein
MLRPQRVSPAAAVQFLGSRHGVGDRFAQQLAATLAEPVRRRLDGGSLFESEVRGGFGHFAG